MYNQYEELHRSSSRTYVTSGETKVSSRNGGASGEKFETGVSSTYRSAMAPRTISIPRSRPTGLCTSAASAKIRQTYFTAGSNATSGQGLAALIKSSGGVALRGGAAAGGKAAIYGAAEYGAADFGAADFGAAGYGVCATAFNANASPAAIELYSTRLREKRDLVVLNDKFASYVEKVRFLEAHNRKLVMELELLRSRLGQGSSHIKEMYDLEMAEANKLIEDSKRENSIAYGRALEAEETLKRQRTQYESLSILRVTDQKEVDTLKLRIAENEAQIALYRRRMSDVEDEVQLYKKESQRLLAELTCVQGELQNELFLKSSCEFEKVALGDALINTKQTHEAELLVLRGKLVSSDLDPSVYFRNELALAIREIRKDYEANCERQRCELYNRYSLTVNEIYIQNQPVMMRPEGIEERREAEQMRVTLLDVQNQSSYLSAQNQQIQNSITDIQRKLKSIRESNSVIISRYDSEITEARAYLARIEETYAKVMASKVSLENEIATYRRYLESKDGLRGYVERIEQVAQQKLVNRSIGTNALYVSGEREVTKASSSSYINTSGSNYGNGTARQSSYLSSTGNQAASKSSITESLSSSGFTAPRRAESSHAGLYQESSGRIGTYQAHSGATQDSTKRSSIIRSGLSSSRESLTRSLVGQNSPKRTSLLPDTANSSHESISYENSFEDATRDGDYDTVGND
ncbi:unnamed protein product [Rotaria sp. Silwood1]|nr:unnamed protein product [Rotaria sp. Silwood1]CAF1065559.1 unnamed protein product [Rotaria sp. Silwood1]CAF3399548.1 unnamed protein product [Rotaria sp. Silwood1]CAF3435638.1 unnamed protein product [Rotaria sp. Silwood1]CAF4846149.1 unnamed protein product [Rotaria sp. Silwood1]